MLIAHVAGFVLPSLCQEEKEGDSTKDSLDDLFPNEEEEHGPGCKCSASCACTKTPGWLGENGGASYAAPQLTPLCVPQCPTSTAVQQQRLSRVVMRSRHAYVPSTT